MLKEVINLTFNSSYFQGCKIHYKILTDYWIQLPLYMKEQFLALDYASLSVAPLPLSVQKMYGFGKIKHTMSRVAQYRLQNLWKVTMSMTMST